MIFTMGNITTPDSLLRLTMIDLATLMVEKGHQPTRGYGFMGMWLIAGLMRINVDVIPKTLQEDDRVLTIEKLRLDAPFLFSEGFEQHFEDNKEEYLSAYRLLHTEMGRVDHLYTWMSMEEPVQSPLLTLAKHLGVKCFNLAEPSTRQKIEDWTIHHSISF